MPDGAGHVALRPGDRVFEADTPGEVGRNGRRERAAGAVRVPPRHALRAELREPVPVVQQIHDVGRGQVAPLHEHRGCAQRHTHSRDLDDSAWEHLTFPWKAPTPKGTTYVAKGCLECRMTGYMGRVGIYETMVMTRELRKAITPQTDLATLQDIASKEGMKPLRISGAMKIAAGMTTVDEVLQNAPPPTGDRRRQPR